MRALWETAIWIFKFMFNFFKHFQIRKGPSKNFDEDSLAKKVIQSTLNINIAISKVHQAILVA